MRMQVCKEIMRQSVRYYEVSYFLQMNSTFSNNTNTKKSHGESFRGLLLKNNENNNLTSKC